MYSLNMCLSPFPSNSKPCISHDGRNLVTICLSFLQVDCTHGTNETKGWWTTLKLSLVPQQASSIYLSSSSSSWIHLLVVIINPKPLPFRKMYKGIRKKKREAFNDVKLAQTRCQPC